MAAPSNSTKIVVIGSGFGGLAAAIRLQTRGYQVTLLEARDQLGGRAYVYRQDGFTFDAGPTVITAPFLIDELFAGAGRQTREYVEIVPVDPFYRIEFHDGRHFEYNADEAATEQKVADFSPDDVDGYRRMIRETKAIFQKGFVELSDQPFLKFTDMLRVAPDLIRLHSYRTVSGFVAGYIKDPLLRRVFSFHPLLVGGNPFQTTSIYALIHHLEREWGVHYAMGGTGAVVEALGRLFRELGGHICLNTPVRQILTEGGRARGVETARGDRLDAEAVVSNADVANTYRRLLPASVRRKYTDERLAKMRYSMSLFVLYFGTRTQYPGIRHHTILLGPRYEELLADIFNKKVLRGDFSVYLHRPTATDASMAPPGHDCFYALVPVPHQGSGIDWTQEAGAFRERVVDMLERYLPGLRQNIVTERLFTPLDFETTLNSYLGSGFSFEPVLTQSAWFRPHNVSEDVEQLYFVGAGTHPGAGLPGVLCSAKIAERLICERLPAVTLDELYGQAAQVTAAGSKSFYFATRFFPPELAKAAHAVYWFCRHTDDLVDEAPSVAQGTAQLEAWSLAFEEMVAGAAVRDPILRAFDDTRRRYGIPAEYPRELIEGMRMDLHAVRYESFADLRVFCYRVASVVGLMMSHVIGFREPALTYAIDLGIAMQLTNILRDIGEDLQRGRIYLPREDMARFGYSEDDLRRHVRNNEFRALMNFQAARARSFYEAANPGIALLDPKGRFAVQIASDVYRAILRRIEDNEYDAFTRRAVVPPMQKYWITARGLAGPMARLALGRTWA